MRACSVSGIAGVEVDNRSNAPYHDGYDCAIFEIPRSTKVMITGGSEICAWSDDDFPDDVHYSFTIIRTTLAVGG